MPDTEQAQQAQPEESGCGCKAKAAEQGQPTEIPCFTPEQAGAAYDAAGLHEDWLVDDRPQGPAHVLYRKYEFPTFQKAMDFVQAAGSAAESLDHHPVNIQVVFRTVHMLLQTVKANGLSQADFDLARKMDEAQESDPR